MTSLASVFAALFLLVILLFVTPWFAYVPVPVMAGVILLVAWRMIDVSSVLHLIRLSAGEAAIALITLVCALFIDLEISIYVGVFLSAVLFIERSSRPHVSVGVPNLARRRPGVRGAQRRSLRALSIKAKPSHRSLPLFPPIRVRDVSSSYILNVQV